MKNKILLIWICSLADPNKTAAAVMFHSRVQEASSPLFFFVLLWCPALTAQKTHEIQQEDLELEGLRMGNNPMQIFFTSYAQVLSIFILYLSCFHCADTNPPWNWLILPKPCLHGRKFHLVVLMQRPVSALWQERLLNTIYYKHKLLNLER